MFEPNEVIIEVDDEILNDVLSFEFEFKPNSLENCYQRFFIKCDMTSNLIDIFLIHKNHSIKLYNKDKVLLFDFDCKVINFIGVHHLNENKLFQVANLYGTTNEVLYEFKN